jgi:hypothetical protein
MRKSKQRKAPIFNNESTHETIELLRQTDKTLDAIHYLSPTPLWKKLLRNVKRELLYSSAIAWQVPITLAIYLVLFWIVLAIIF